MVSNVGAARVTFALSPDPPRLGTEAATVTVAGVPNGVLSKTAVTFSSSMPAMGMSGASGTARAVAGEPGRWTFDLPMGSAAQWSVVLRFAGGVNGSATFTFEVPGASSMSASPSPTASASASAASSMSAGQAGVWQTAAFALAILFALAVIAAFQFAREAERRGSKPQWFTPATIRLAAIALVVILGTAILQNRFAPPAMDMAAMSNVPGTAPIPVTLAPVRAARADRQITAPGVVEAYYMQDVAARTAGVLRDVFVYNGDLVSAGQVVAVLDEPDLAAQAAAARAGWRSDLASARAARIAARQSAPNGVAIARAELSAREERARYWRGELARERFLLAHGAVSPQEFTDERAQATAAFSAAQAARKALADANAQVSITRAQAQAARERAAAAASNAAAQEALAGYTRLVAPGDGVVVKRLADPGSTVQAGTPVLRIAVVKEVRIAANVAQEYLRGIAVGARFDATVDGGATIRARVTSVQPAADPATHTAIVEAVVANPGDRLRPGTYASVTIEAHWTQVKGALQVPSGAVVGSAGDASVWTEVKGTAHRVPVTVLYDDGRQASVKGALKRGDLVVVQGAQNLQEGQPIARVRARS